jgi:hypothetical protein
MDNLSNFRLLPQTKNEKIENQIAFQQSNDKNYDQDDINCEQWAQARKAHLL